MNVRKEVENYAFLVFTLLGVLFGSMLVVFILAQIGPDQAGLTPNTNAYNVSAQVQNDSLQAVSTYTSNSSTQFSITAISVVLLILIGLFALFMKSFMKHSKSGSSSFS